MNNDLDLEKVKQSISIVDLASQYGANPFGNGNTVHTKFNPIRSEKTSSLKLYRDTNSWADFGSSEGGSIIDFIMKAENIEFNEALTKITGNTFEPTTTIKTIVKNTENKMTPLIVEKCFNGVFHTSINLKKENHLQQLKTIGPEWVFNDSKKDDLDYFMSISKFIESRATTIHKLPNKDGISYTFKYRYYFNEEQNKMIKWCSLPNTISSYLYCRLTGKDLVLVVEGSRDYLTALLCGFDVVSLYSKNYKFTDEDYLLLKGKKVIFIDDFGENAIKNIHDKFDGDKIYFNHNLMRNISKCDSKDFSDYLYHFKSLDEFIKAFNEVTKSSGTWEDGIDYGKALSLEFLDSKPNVEPLFEKFIYKATTTVIHSDPGQGKSTLILSLIKHCIENNKIKKVIYFDADNPPSVLKDRLTNLLTKYKKEVIYFSSALMTTDQMENEMDRLTTYKNQGEDVLIVVDTLGRFVKGSIKNDNDVIPIIAKINRLVIDFGATSIIVHHSNKEKGDGGRPIFQGSQKISGDTDATFGLVRIGKKLNLFRDKARFGYIADIVKMEIDAKELMISNFNAKFIGEEEDEEIEENTNEEIDINLDDLIKFIKNGESVSLSQIKSKFNASKNRPKDKKRADIIWDLIQGNKNIIKWNGESKNKARYSIDSDKPTITEFQETIYDDEALTSIFGD